MGGLRCRSRGSGRTETLGALCQVWEAWQGDAGDVLSAASTADDLDSARLDDGHLLWTVRAAVAVYGDLAVRDLAGRAYRVGAGG